VRRERGQIQRGVAQSRVIGGKRLVRKQLEHRTHRRTRRREWREFEKSYFVEPTDVGVKPFNLLRRAIEETGRLAVARVAIRSKERLATLRVYDSTMVLETMYWPDEIRSPDQLDLPTGKGASPAPREVDMARTLIESLASHFDPDRYRDEFRGSLLALIEKKMKGGPDGGAPGIA